MRKELNLEENKILNSSLSKNINNIVGGCPI
jgi:hypothetical protein